MDDDRKRAAIKLTVEKAREDLTAANELADLSHARAAINRAYYAVFHAATAVLLWHDIERSKHTGVQSALNQFLVKPGIIEVDQGRLFRKIREWREEQDYDLFAETPDDEMVRTLVADAGRFLARMEQYLRMENVLDEI